MTEWSWALEFSICPFPAFLELHTTKVIQFFLVRLASLEPRRLPLILWNQECLDDLGHVVGPHSSCKKQNVPRSLFPDHPAHLRNPPSSKENTTRNIYSILHESIDCTLFPILCGIFCNYPHWWFERVFLSGFLGWVFCSTPLNQCTTLPKILDAANRFEKPKRSPNVAEVFCGKLFQGYLTSQIPVETNKSFPKHAKVFRIHKLFRGYLASQIPVEIKTSTPGFSQDHWPPSTSWDLPSSKQNKYINKPHTKKTHFSLHYIVFQRISVFFGLSPPRGASLNPCKVLPKILDTANRFEKPKHSPNVAEVFCGKLFQGYLTSQIPVEIKKLPPPNVQKHSG